MTLQNIKYIKGAADKNGLKKTLSVNKAEDLLKMDYTELLVNRFIIPLIDISVALALHIVYNTFSCHHFASLLV